MLENSIRFTCLVPAFNSASTISLTIQSLLNQTVKDLKVVVLNNGSTDETVDILEGITDPRLLVISYEHVSSLGESLNRCFNKNLISSKYFSICHADDIYNENFVQISIREMDFFNNPTILFCLARHINHEGNLIKDPYVSCKNYTNILFPKYSGFLGVVRILTWNTLFAPSAVFSTLDIYRYSKFSNILTLYTDAFFWSNWLLSGYQIRVMNNKLLYYRIHSKQQSSWARLRVNQFSEINVFRSLMRDKNNLIINILILLCFNAHKFLRIIAKLIRFRM